MHNSFSDTEKELLSRVAVGDEKAFKELFNEYWDNIYGVAFVMTKSREAARDIVQEVFIKVWLLREELVQKDSFRNFLFIMARNHIFSELRKRKRDQTFIDQLMVYFNDEGNETDQSILYNESAALINEAVSKLSPQQREVYVLAREKGWSQDEIAEHLGISKATIKTHMSRALTSIRQYLQEHSGGILLFVTVLRAHL